MDRIDNDIKVLNSLLVRRKKTVKIGIKLKELSKAA